MEERGDRHVLFREQGHKLTALAEDVVGHHRLRGNEVVDADGLHRPAPLGPAQLQIDGQRIFDFLELQAQPHGLGSPQADGCCCWRYLLLVDEQLVGVMDVASLPVHFQFKAIVTVAAGLELPIPDHRKGAINGSRGVCARPTGRPAEIKLPIDTAHLGPGEIVGALVVRGLQPPHP